MNKCPKCGKEYKKQHKVCKGGEPTFVFKAAKRPVKRSGRPPAVKPGMDAMIASWKGIPVGETFELPDNSGETSHHKVTLDRHHFKVRAVKAGLTPGVDYTIETGEDGPVITRLR